MLNDFRPLVVNAGGKQIAEDLRVEVQGSKNMTLLSDFFIFKFYNLGSQDLAAIKDNNMLYAVGKDGGTVCGGEIDEIYTQADNVNIITTISVIDGKSFWNTKINKSFGGGSTVSDTFRNLVQNASIGAYTANDFRLIRGQTYSGRLADSISMLAKSVGGRAFITNNTVYITAKGRSSITININDDEIVDDRNNGTGLRIIKTDVKGYPVGTLVTVQGKQYRLVSQKINADNYKGSWESLLVLIDEKELSSDGMVGG